MSPDYRRRAGTVSQAVLPPPFAYAVSVRVTPHYFGALYIFKDTAERKSGLIKNTGRGNQAYG